jgi:ferritin-like protein
MKAMVRLLTVPPEQRDMDWVREGLRAAVQLELSTIPPYLYAIWSIGAASDPSDCAGTIQTIVEEEMLHMGIACNLLKAVGGTPDIIGLAPRYPTQLPKHVHTGLEVGLKALSSDVVHDTFMAIEEPVAHLVDDPQFPPSGATLIGQFYDDLVAALEKNAPTFTTAGQIDLTAQFAAPYVIGSIEDAKAAVDVIKRQGEGTATGPFENQDQPTELAHFYQFGEMYHGRKLTTMAPFAYSGDPVTLPTVPELPVGPPDMAEAKAFDQAYSDMLRQLDDAWNQGSPAVLRTAVRSMFRLLQRMNALRALGFGPAFRPVNAHGDPIPPPEPAENRFDRVRQILDAAVGDSPVHGHGPFWRGVTRDQFVQLVKFGLPVVTVGDGAGSNLVKALRGETPFGADLGVPDAFVARMPKGLPPVPDADIAVIEQWIDDGCPDAAADQAPDVPPVSNTTGAFRPDPTVHVAYFRDLDNWALYEATPEVAAAIDIVQAAPLKWLAYAKDPAAEQAWLDAISTDDARAAFALLATRQQQTVEAHYGVPVPLLALLDGYERFGNDGLPDDPLRPQEPRHNMDGAIMWFFLAAFAEACLRLQIAVEFWTFMMRPILCGLLNDGLFRHRFHVEGFTATDAGREAVFAFVQQVPDDELPAELRRRYVQSLP